jgi:predicted NAD/FAD-binding protein
MLARHLWLFFLARNGDAVTLFEKEAVCGGHTLTDHSSPYPVDLGFQARADAFVFKRVAVAQSSAGLLVF